LCDLGVGGYGFVALVKKNETPISVDGLPSSPPVEDKNIHPVFLAVKYGIDSQDKAFNFQNEAAFVEKEVKKLSENCRYIVKIEEVIKVQNRSYIVMEFCGCDRFF
jgi:serine/threonine protein kinase